MGDPHYWWPLYAFNAQIALVQWQASNPILVKKNAASPLWGWFMRICCFSFPFWAILVCGNWNSSSFSTNVPHYWSLRVCPMPCSHVFFGESFVLKSPSLLNLGSVVLACDLQCQCTFRFVVPDMGSSRVTSVSSYFCSRLVTLWILQWKALVKFMPPHPVKSSVRKHSNTFNVPQVFEFAHF